MRMIKGLCFWSTIWFLLIFLPDGDASESECVSSFAIALQLSLGLPIAALCGSTVLLLLLIVVTGFLLSAAVNMPL